MSATAISVSDVGPYSIIPAWVLGAGVSDRALRLYCEYGAHADNRTGRAYPSRERLAKRLGCSVRSVNRAREELERVGAVALVTNGSGRHATVIRVHYAQPTQELFEAAAELVRDQAAVLALVPDAEPEPPAAASQADLFEAWQDVVGRQPATKTERLRWAASLKELRAAGVTPDELRDLCRRYREWTQGRTELTLRAIAGNLSTLRSTDRRTATGGLDADALLEAARRIKEDE